MADGDLGLASPTLGIILTHSRGDFVHLRSQSPPNVNSRIDAQVAHRRSADVVFGVLMPIVSSRQFSHANGIALRNADAVPIRAEGYTRLLQWRVVRKWR